MSDPAKLGMTPKRTLTPIDARGKTTQAKDVARGLANLKAV